MSEAGFGPAIQGQPSGPWSGPPRDDVHPAQRSLWQWPEIPAARPDRTKRAMCHFQGVFLIALGFWFLHVASQPDCVGRICARGPVFGPLAIAGGVLRLVFPHLGRRARGFFTEQYRLTAYTFYRSYLGRTTEIPLHDGRVVIRYQKAWLEREEGPDLSLTRRLPQKEAEGLFAAFGQAREIRASYKKEPA